MTRAILLLGTPKGAFILEGTTDRRDWRLRGPVCEGWPVHDISVDACDGSAPGRRRQPLVRTGRPAQRRPRRDLDPLQRGAHLRGRRPEGRDGLERDGRPRRDLRGRRARRPVPVHGRRGDLVPRRGADEPPQPGGVGTGRRRPDPAHDHPPPHRPCADVGRHLRGGHVRDPRRRRDLADAEQGRPRRLPSREVPRVRSVRPQGGPRRGRRRAALPAEPLRRVPLHGRRRGLGRGHRRAAVAVRVRRWRPTRATR